LAQADLTVVGGGGYVGIPLMLAFAEADDDQRQRSQRGGAVVAGIGQAAVNRACCGAREEAVTDIGISGIVAAKPVRPSLEADPGLGGDAEHGMARNERAAIFNILRDAVPEFRGESA
jgi:hypothetical protein